jgi:hypothetical protein
MELYPGAMQNEKKEAPSKTRAEWQALAKAKLKLDLVAKAKDPKAIFDLNKRVTAAYAEMYLRDPSKFLWAGMAALASDEVGKGMKKAFDAIKEPPIRENAKNLFYGLLLGNQSVYADMYWQHLAYAEKGIGEMKKLRDSGELPPELFDAWEKIDKGQAWDGNRLLLRYEQEKTLQEKVYKLLPNTFTLISHISKIVPSILSSPIPGDEGSFQKIIPGGNLGKFEDRWKWIDTSMLPAWRKLVENDAAKVKGIMEEFVKRVGS